MKSTAERAYIYAKACGIIGKSFVGPRIRRLQDVNRLSDLDRLLFPDSYEDLPERELLVRLEKRIIARTTNQIHLLLKTQQTIPKFIELLLRSYEYADVKLLVSALMEKENLPPPHADLGRFTTVHFEKYPDPKAMFAGTDFEWILDTLPETQSDNMRLQAELDQRYYAALWDELNRISDPAIRYIKEIIAEEIELKNILWALRLKFYYNFDKPSIEALLLHVQDGKRSLVKTALSCIDKPGDQFAPWTSFEYQSLLNPEEPGTLWRLNVPYVQRKAALLLYKKARTYFLRSPFSLNTTACFIKLKQFEEDLLISLAEGISLGLSGREVLSMLEVLQ
jgi:vacuolar-type H+-ATPase subunit C/Vma6